MIQMLPLISKKLKMQESASPQQKNLETDEQLLKSISSKIKTTSVKNEVDKLLKSVISQIEYLMDNPNHYE